MRNKENIFYKEINGKVIKGKQLGQSIGYPTANIEVKENEIEEGTYRINGIIEGKVLKGAGVLLGKSNIFESHFIDFNGNLYGKNIKIIIFYKIRENKEFKDTQELKKEIKEDIDYIKNNPDYVLTFGTFDEIHLGHQFYLEQAKTYGDKLVTIIAKGENVEKFKGHKPKYSEENRLKKLRSIGIPNIVHIGNTKDPLSWLELYNPRVICLGYDQVGFSPMLKKFIKENNLNIKVVRINPYKENKFKSSIIKKIES